jgi:eukaryotic-like serine/threonine-protein kinase
MRIEEVILPETQGNSTITVVEKRLSTRDRDEPEAAARFAQEIALLRTLAGRVTPRLLDAGRDARGPWLRMEKIAFPTLAQRLEQAGAALERGWVERLAKTAFAALAELHEASDEHGELRIVHADLSPSNLAASDDATRVVLLDLELASWRDGVARDGAFRGTVGYCAPEIAREETPTIASDLFALGAVLVHATTGIVPRDGPSLAAVLARAAERPLLEDAHVAGADLPTAIRACLAHDPGGRPRSARAVLAALC